MTCTHNNESKLDVIILAGGEKGPLYEPTGYLEKALIPVHGKPMLSRVIDCFHDSQQVDRIVVVGSRNLDGLESMQRVRKRIFVGLNVVQNLLHAVTYIKHRLRHSRSDHTGYVVSFCDAVFLTPRIVDDTLSTIRASDADVVLHYVRRESFEEAGLPAKRTYLPVGGMELTGGTIYYVRRFSKVFAAIPKLIELRKHRKDPSKFLQLLNCEPGDSLADIQSNLSAELGFRVQIEISPHAGLGMDVDKPADLELANKLLA